MEKFFYISFLVCLAHFLAVNVFYFSTLLFSWLENRFRSRQERAENSTPLLSSDFTIPVSVIVPAYNEEKVILDTVLSVLRNGYPQYEVIVVNDGSTDGTLKLLQREFELEPMTLFHRRSIPTEKIRGTYRSKKHPQLLVIDKVNGKTHADASNAGLNLSRYRYVLSVDADTVLEEGAILRAVRLALRNPREVVGVGSLLGLSNGFDIRKGMIRAREASRQILVNFQVVEYFRAFLANRLGWSRGNFNMCVSGAFSLWRRDVLIEMGGFRRDFSCDDLEMTYRVHEHFRRNKIPYRILSLADPVAWTEGPSTTFGLYQQRHRWQRVQTECAGHYWRMLFNPRYGTAGLLGAPYMLFAEVIGPTIELFAYLLVPIGWFLGMLNLEQLGIFLLCSAGLSSLLSIASLALFDSAYPIFRMRDLVRLMIASSAEFLGYRQVLSVARFLGTIATFRGVKEWNKLEREGYATSG